MKTGINYLSSLKLEIEQSLIRNQDHINQLKEMRDGNITFLAELFLEELLNAIYSTKGWHFSNLNNEKFNHPAIDLADKKNKICFQVTVTNSKSGINDKIRDTLVSFYNQGLDSEYNELYIIIASGIQDKAKVRIPPLVKINERDIPVFDSLITRNHVVDLVDLSNIIFEDSQKDFEKIKDVLVKTASRPKRKKYDPVQNYIARTSKDYQGQVVDITQYFVEEKRVALLGVGGLGKTTELNYVASRISTKENAFCFVVRLIKYANSLEELLGTYCTNWINAPEDSQVYFLLDGFDEIDSSKQEQAKNDIQQFAVRNKNIQILVSCRNNFNPFEVIDSNPSSKEADQFIDRINA